MSGYRRIACLSTEAVETLYALGAQDAIAGISGFTTQPAPDIIIGSWCGKKFRPDTLCARAGWDAIPAVRNGMVVEIKSADILSPGPAAIAEGLRQMSVLVARWHERKTA